MKSLMIFYCLVAFFGLGIVSGDPTIADIQAEGMACFEMAATMPELMSLTGEQSTRDVELISSSSRQSVFQVYHENLPHSSSLISWHIVF